MNIVSSAIIADIYNILCSIVVFEKSFFSENGDSSKCAGKLQSIRNSFSYGLPDITVIENESQNSVEFRFTINNQNVNIFGVIENNNLTNLSITKGIALIYSVGNGRWEFISDKTQTSLIDKIADINYYCSQLDTDSSWMFSIMRKIIKRTRNN